MILPVVGLLLLLGLFWYWASTLIGDDDNKPGSTPTAQVIVSTQPAGSTETTGQQPETTATTGAENPQPTTEPTTQTGNNGGEATETATEEATESSGEAVSTAFAEDDIVVTNDAVRMREDPDATSTTNIIEELDANTELTIIGGPQEGPGPDGTLVWWEVEDSVTGNTGWVAEDFLEKSGS